MQGRINYWVISIFWLGVSIHWAAFLTIVMQVRTAELVPPEIKGTMLGVLSAAGALISTVIELIAGPISDRSRSRWGRRRPFIFWGTLLSLPFIGLFMVAPNFPMLVACFVAIQLFLNWANGPYQAVIPDYVPPERHGCASAYMGMMTLVGNLVGLALAGLTLSDPPILLAGLPYPTRLLIVGAALMLCLLVTMLWTVLGLREPAWQLNRPDEALLYWHHFLDIWMNDHPNFRLVVLSRFAYNLGFYTVLFFLEYYLRDTMGLGNQAPFSAFVVTTIATVTGVFGNGWAGIIADSRSKKWVIYQTVWLMGIATLLFLFAPNLVWVYLLAGLFGFAWGAFSAVDWALASNLVPPKESGRYMAIWHISMTVPQVVAPLIAGPLGDWINQTYGLGVGWRWGFMTIPIYLIIGSMILRHVREMRHTQYQ